jgi:hypothetical protein
VEFGSIDLRLVGHIHSHGISGWRWSGLLEPDWEDGGARRLEDAVGQTDVAVI